jgi:hypothetical protein
MASGARLRSLAASQGLVINVDSHMESNVVNAI